MMLKLVLLIFLLSLPLYQNKGFAFEHYSNIGLASWYGIKFQGKKTSSGMLFDMHEFTAAHKFLPFGTIVKVINLRNGKEVIVNIIDRGPFSKKRIIDLSHAAAKSIGLVNKGIAKVKIEVISTP
jgi:peptidoglycan lytic transglycosylase